eukprot:48337-Amphidinium_carterae.4
MGHFRSQQQCKAWDTSGWVKNCRWGALRPVEQPTQASLEAIITSSESPSQGDQHHTCWAQS